MHPELMVLSHKVLFLKSVVSQVLLLKAVLCAASVALTSGQGGFGVFSQP